MTAETLILLAVAMAALLAAQGVYYAVIYLGERKQTELSRRLRSVTTEARADAGGLLRAGRMGGSPATARVAAMLPRARELERLLMQTDLTWTVAGVYGAGFFVGLGVAVALTLLLPQPTILVLLVIPAAIAAPILWAAAQRNRRSNKLSAQLPDALDMMVRSLRAGHGIGAAFRLVAQEMPDPVAVEFGRCFEEQQAGAPTREAVRNMTERMPDNLDLRILATSIVIQSETGGNLVELLEGIANTIRERYKFYGKLQALTSEAKMSGRILGALPIVSLLAVTMLNPEYTAPLFVETAGNLILVVGLILWIAGVVSMRRLAQVEF